MTYAMCGRLGCRHHDGDGCTLETVDLITSPVIGVPHCKDFEVVGDVRRAQPGADPIDLVKRELGELRRYKQELADARGSRDHWRKRADEIEQELIMMKAERDACWVKLPVDAEGEAIRPGDKLCHAEIGVPIRPNLTLHDWGWRVGGFRGEDLRHVTEEPRTVEDVLADFGAEVASGYDTHEAARIYANEIRELLGVDDGEE